MTIEGVRKVILCRAMSPLLLLRLLFLPILILLLFAAHVVSKAAGGEDVSRKYELAGTSWDHQHSYLTKPYFANVVYGEGHPLCAFLDNQGYTMEQFGGKGCGSHLQENRYTNVYMCSSTSSTVHTYYV